VRGGGRKGRILREDIAQYVKSALGAGATFAIPETVIQVAAAPAVDFSSFGETEVQPLPKIRRIAAANLYRSWVTVPHVTRHDEADITDLEALRVERAAADASGVKLTMLAFLMKAVSAALKEFPRFAA